MHGEVTDAAVDFFDREKVFIEQKLKPILEKVRDLRIVMEHITTKDAADFVQQGPDNLAASITPQHMLLNRNALFLVRCCSAASVFNHHSQLNNLVCWCFPASVHTHHTGQVRFVANVLD